MSVVPFLPLDGTITVGDLALTVLIRGGIAAAFAGGIALVIWAFRRHPAALRIHDARALETRRSAR